MRNLALMILVVILIIINTVVIVELFNYGRNIKTSILLLFITLIIIIAIVKSWSKTSNNYDG